MHDTLEIKPRAIAQTKAHVWNALEALPGPDVQQALATHFSADCQWHTSHPINQLCGPAEINARFWQPLMAAIPDMERRTDIFFGGYFDGRFHGGAGNWACATGYYVGTFVQDWLGIPATGEPIFVRFGEFYRFEGGKIVEARVLLDIVDVMRQAGFLVLPPSRGLDIVVPGPRGHDGLLLGPQDESITTKTINLVENMIGGLMSFDKQNLASMGMHAYWHPDMMWYGPCGIGTNRRVEGFQKHHQKPFLVAFPDRKGGDHDCRIGEGHFLASTGWPSVRATHSGIYLGVPACHQRIEMRVMDWWRREGDILRENWVLIDLPHLMLQMGVDLMDRLYQAVKK